MSKDRLRLILSEEGKPYRPQCKKPEQPDQEPLDVFLFDAALFGSIFLRPPETILKESGSSAPAEDLQPTEQYDPQKIYG